MSIESSYTLTRVLDQTSLEKPQTFIRMLVPSRKSRSKPLFSLDSTHGLIALLREEMDTISSRTQECYSEADVV